MSRHKTEREDPPPNRRYDVGYAKPPVAKQFQPGTSGNPAGRPKGARNRAPKLSDERLNRIILEEAYREVPVRDGEKTVTVPIAQAVIRALGVKAAKGDHRSQRLFAELLGGTETANKRLHDAYLEAAIVYKTDWDRELERRERLQITAPDPIPHPDDIEINMATGEVIIKGPMTKEEKAHHQEWRAYLARSEQEMADLRSELAAQPDHPNRNMIEQDIEHEEQICNLIRAALPD